MRDVAHHRGGGLVLDGLERGAERFVAERQQRKLAGGAEKAVFAIEPNGRRREAITRNERQFHRSLSRRSADLGGLPDGDAGVARGQQVEPLVARRHQRFDVALTRQPRATVSVVAPEAEGCRSGIDHRFPMRAAAGIDRKILGGVARIGKSTDRQRGGPAIAADGHQLIGLGHPAAQRHRHAVGDAAIWRVPRPDIAVLPRDRTDRVMARARRRDQHLLLGRGRGGCL